MTRFCKKEFFMDIHSLLALCHFNESLEGDHKVAAKFFPVLLGDFLVNGLSCSGVTIQDRLNELSHIGCDASRKVVSG
jgi:hypothetical protein